MRLWRIDAWKTHPVNSQREVLQDLITSAQYTEFGKKYHFSKLFNVRDLESLVISKIALMLSSTLNFLNMEASCGKAFQRS